MMANAIYPKWKEAVLNGGTNVALSGTVKAALVDTNDVSYNAAHDFYDDISAGVVGTPVALAGKTYTNGLFDADNTTILTVVGDQSEALVLFIDTGDPATSRLVAWIDTGVTGLPITPSGGNIQITWNASGIFQL
jgi:hypothetical protein